MLGRTRQLGPLALCSFVLALLVLAAACGGGESQQPATPTPGLTSTIPPSTGTPVPTLEPRPTVTPGAYSPPAGTANVFGNPGFEDGRTYWYSLKPPDYEVSQDYAHSGQSSAHLEMLPPAAGDTVKAKVYYLVQEVGPKEFPELISGYYRVENWTKGTQKQYLQFVVIIWAPTNYPTTYGNYQTRNLLAGINQEPFAILNAKFIFLTKEEPLTGEWVYFERNIKEDFEQLWGAVPEGFSKMRLLFEVRYDDRASTETNTRADVYYDDLYMGPASENPNQP